MREIFAAFVLSILIGGAFHPVKGQTAQLLSYWNSSDESALPEDLFRPIIPDKYLVFELDLSALRLIMDQAPLINSNSTLQPIISLPDPNGGLAEYRVYKSPVMDPLLAAKYPEIQTYTAVSIEDPSITAKLDFTYRGFHAMIFHPKGRIFIDPYAWGQVDHYLVYWAVDATRSNKEKDENSCGFDPKVHAGTINSEFGNSTFDQPEAGDCQLRTYRLALSTTIEYSNYHGNTLPLVNSAITTTMNRVNGMFERDIAVTMVLVPNNDLNVYLSPGPDPFTNGNGGAMLGQNQTTCDNNIGSANYDIGHVFSTGGGGVAYLNSPCNNSIKAGGVTGQPNPVGDPFDIDYVAHEMGHQYGGNHTQNNGCNRAFPASVEPGSASSIMGYAGICAPNVQSNSDALFHAWNIQEMSANIVSGTSSTCPVTTNLAPGNTPPNASGGSDYTIPALTPFTLTGSATDGQGSGSLTYTWEQIDPEFSGVTMPPSASNTQGPAFRTFLPSNSPERTVPLLDSILNNGGNGSWTWEQLSSVTRNYDFRFTVRDNNPGGGCTDEDDVRINVDGGSGPFVVTNPNTAVTWMAFTSETVTWNVASTTSSPVSCANVDILLSIDGGQTYPITLASNTPNDGSQSISVPNNPSTTARVKVICSNNIFFDISDVDFTITAPASPDFGVSISPTDQTICQPANGVYTVSVSSVLGFSSPVSLSVSGLPAGVNASFSPAIVNPPGNSTLTISNTVAAALGTSNFTVTGVSGALNHNDQASITIDAAPPAPTLLSPANAATGVSTLPMLSWSNVLSADDYDIEIATDMAFSSVVASQSGLGTNSWTPGSSLNPNTQYYWHVRSNNFCGSSGWTATWSFTTANIVCIDSIVSDVPIFISSSGTPTVVSTIDIPFSGTITDVDVLDLDISHTWIGDLEITLISPAGTRVILFERSCGSNDDMDLNFDDAAASAAVPCPPTTGATIQPVGSLASFNSENVTGTWTLEVDDQAGGDGGSLNGWTLHLCVSGFTPPAPPPVPACRIDTSTDVPQNITSVGTPSISSDLTVGFSGVIADVNVINLDVAHTYIDDLIITLMSPNGTTVTLLNRPCGGQDDIFMSLDDEAASGFFPCPPINGLAYQPAGNLSDFIGEDPNGTWTLSISDNANLDGGSLDGWGLEICIYIPLCPPPDIPLSAGTYSAEFECTDGTWTHYLQLGTPNLLVLSVLKDGTVEIHPDGVRTGLGTPGAAVNMSSASYVTNPDGWYVMNRWWDVNPSVQPGPTGADVRFYYPTSDFNDVNTAIQASPAGGSLASVNDLVFYKFSSGSGIDPNPANGHVGANSSDYLELSTSNASFGAYNYGEFHVDGFSGGGAGSSGAGGGDGALPVELINFDGYHQTDIGNMLNWSTAVEIDNDFFILERSLDGMSFKELARIDGHGNTTIRQDYSFVDSDFVPGLQYYRLLQVDFDGSVEDLGIVAIQVSLKDLSIELMPNPTSGYLRIEVPSGSYQIEIRNAIGQIVKTLQTSNAVDVDLSDQSNGFYVVTVSAGEEMREFKLIKQ